MKNQHTPGPWEVIDMENEPKQQKVGTLGGMGHALIFGDTETESKANAHLIASAPDLLDALRFLLADYIAIQGDRLTGSSVPIEKAKAAIAKAEGNL